MDFEQLISFLNTSGLNVAATLLSVIFGLVIMVVQLKKYKIQSNQAKEQKDMKYRTESYQSAKGFEPYKQTFKRVVPVYELDESSKNLVVVGTKDLQELIQSSRDCGLDVVLEKYGALPPQMLPEVSSVSSEPYDATDIRDDLCILADFAEDIENMRVRYNMPMASFDELQKHIAKLKLDTDKKIQSELETQAKGVKKDEIPQD